jgi:hypothetical protein
LIKYNPTYECKLIQEKCIKIKSKTTCLPKNNQEFGFLKNNPLKLLGVCLEVVLICILKALNNQNSPHIGPIAYNLGALIML